MNQHRNKPHRRREEDDHHDKEQAVMLGLQQGMGVMRKGFEVHGMRLDGSVEVLARNQNPHELWHEAHQALKDKLKLPQEEPLVCDPEQPADCLKVYTDGGSRGNPGPSASGYVVMDENDQILEQGGEYLGVTTNNQAEYHAVKMGLTAALKYQPKHVDFYMDSQLVVNQLKGEYKVKNRDLQPVHQEILTLVSRFNNVTFHHVYREFNKLADREVNIVLDREAKNAS